MTAWKVVTILGLSMALVLWTQGASVMAHDAEGDDHAHAETDSHAGSETGKHGEGHAAHSGSPNPMVVDPDLAIWTAIVFFVLLAILGKFAWGPIVAALEHREKVIADNIQAAKNQHEEAKRLLTDYERKLAHAADEVRKIMEEARRDAEQTKADILTEAKQAATAEHERAMRDVRNATDGALKQLAETSANLAVELAGKIVGQRLSPADHARLVRESLAEFPNQN